MKRKPAQLDIETHRIIRREARHQSRPGRKVTMGGVIAQLAVKLGKKRGR